MERNNDFAFNSRWYEERLSVFGKKVLKALKQKWNADRNNLHNTYQRTFIPSLQNGRIATSSPPIICHEINSTRGLHKSPLSDIITSERNVTKVPTATELVALPDAITTFKETTNEDYEHAEHYSDNQTTKYSINKTNNTCHIQQYITRKQIVEYKTPTNDKERNRNEINWSNMFDTELLPEAITTNTIATYEAALKQHTIAEHNNFDIKIPSESNEATDTKTTKTKPKKANMTKSKRKNQSITDIIPKRVKILPKTGKQKNNYREQKYTKTVKNWLDDVNPNHPVEEENNIHKDNEENRNEANNFKLLIEKADEKKHKKIIQAQLTNKGGVMKFGKPKAEVKQIETNEKNNVVVESQKNILPKDKKEKKTKPKFVTPTKSQIPVRNKTYHVVTLSGNVNGNHSELPICHGKDVTVVLIYSNGFCQLNSHHTEGSCSSKDVMVSVDDTFYYIKGDDLSHRDILRSTIENNNIICYEGKSLLIYLKSKLDLEIVEVQMMDVEIGGSLISPDNPPENFSELQKLVSFTPEFTIATECILQKTAWYMTLLKQCASKLVTLLKEENLWNLYEEIEMKLIPIIADMERRGVAVDLEKLKSMEDILVTQMKAIELECYKAAGKTFKINSAAQVRGLIYELQLDAKCNLKVRDTIRKGAKSTSESMLRSLISVHPLPKLILEYRHLHKVHATFVAGIAQHVKDGVVRPTWDQTAAATGPIASNDPNLQAIPKVPFNLVLFLEDDALGV